MDRLAALPNVVPSGGAISRLPALIGRARVVEVILGSMKLDGATAEW